MLKFSNSQILIFSYSQILNLTTSQHAQLILQTTMSELNRELEETQICVPSATIQRQPEANEANEITEIEPSHTTPSLPSHESAQASRHAFSTKFVLPVDPSPPELLVEGLTPDVKRPVLDEPSIENDEISVERNPYPSYSVTSISGVDIPPQAGNTIDEVCPELQRPQLEQERELGESELDDRRSEHAETGHRSRLKKALRNIFACCKSCYSKPSLDPDEAFSNMGDHSQESEEPVAIKMNTSSSPGMEVATVGIDPGTWLPDRTHNFARFVTKAWLLLPVAARITKLPFGKRTVARR